MGDRQAEHIARDMAFDGDLDRVVGLAGELVGSGQDFGDAVRSVIEGIVEGEIG